MKQLASFILFSLLIICTSLNFYGCTRSPSGSMKSDHITREGNYKEKVEVDSVADPAEAVNKEISDSTTADGDGDSGGDGDGDSGGDGGGDGGDGGGDGGGNGGGDGGSD